MDLEKKHIGKKVIFQYCENEYKGVIGFNTPYFYILNNDEVAGAFDQSCLVGTNFKYCRSIGYGSIKSQRNCKVVILKVLEHNNNNKELWTY